MLRFRKIVSLLTALVMIFMVFEEPFQTALAAETVTPKTISITSAEDFPDYIEPDTCYELAADITLSAGQQIETVEGILNGCGHVITLADRPLVDSNLGTIENVVITSSDYITLSNYEGPLVINQDGNIYNCYSTTMVTTTSYVNDIGGLVGYIYGGTIANCYVAGQSGTKYLGGIAARCVEPESGTCIANCYYSLATNMGTVKIKKGITPENCGKKTETEFTDGTVAGLLNQDIPDTGYTWTTGSISFNKGYPRLLRIGEDASEARTGLSNTVEIASSYTAYCEYYDETEFGEFVRALTAAEELLSDDNAAEEELENADSALKSIMKTMTRIKPAAPVAAPADETDIQYIETAADLTRISSTDITSYYQLKNDITIDSSFVGTETELNCVLDGNGHTITFDNASNLPLSGVGDTGIVQNVAFTGSINTFDARRRGPLGSVIKGSVINCSTDVSGTYTSGFATRLEGGVLSNCYSVCSGCSVFFEGKNLTDEDAETIPRNTGNLYHCYWQKGLAESDLAGVKADDDSQAMTETEMKDIAFTNLLNENKGEHGTEWGQSVYGYPYFGENQDYDPDGLPLPDNAYEVIFENSKTGEQSVVENHKLYVSPDDIDGYRSVGELSLTGVPEDSTVTWTVSEDSPSYCIMTGSDTGGRITVFNEGRALLTATEKTAEGTSKEVAYVRIFSARKKISEIKLLVNDTDVTSGSCTVAGSEWFQIVPMVKYEDSEEFVSTLSSSFTYISADEELVSNLSASSGEFRFNKCGTSTITVTSASDSTVSAQVNVTSSYVPAESISLTIPSDITLHGRNANSDGGKAFNPNYSSVQVTPSNASCSQNITITSSDPTVGDYVGSMVLGYVPYKAGTTTYTAVLTDTDPDGNVNEISASKEVTYTYKNPLTSVTCSEDKITMEKGSTEKLPLTFTGALSSEGYSVTDPGMTWSFSKKGIVSITQDSGAWKRNTTDADNNLYLPAASYTVVALKAGTVEVTGTPTDPGYEGGKVSFTIIVTSTGEETPADMDGVISGGIGKGKSYLQALLLKNGYKYGQEWNIYTLERLGEEIAAEDVKAYVDSASEVISAWDENHKPTDIAKLSLVLTALGQDITQISGVNLAAMLYNSSRLSAGSNEMTFALLALDAAGTKIPSNAAWTRQTMIDTLIDRFQNDDGGFSLGAGGRSDGDLTAMALQALSRYTDSYEKADIAVENGLEYLRSHLSDTYGYSTGETQSQVILALACLGIDVTDKNNGFGDAYANIVTDLERFENETGFSHVEGGSANDMSTVQATEALCAYREFMTQTDGFWNLNGSGDQEKTVSLKNCRITLSRTSYIYTGKAKTPSVTVETTEGKTLKKGTDYIVSYKSNVNAGKAVVTMKGKGSYTGSVSKSFTIKKAAQKIRTGISKKTLKKAVLTKRKVSFCLGIKVYGGAKVTLKSFSKYVTVNKNGKVTVKKNTRKGTYRIRISALSSKNYGTAYKTFRIHVK